MKPVAKPGGAWRKSRSGSLWSVTCKTIFSAGSFLPTRRSASSTHPHDPTLLQNRCFLYHLIGNKTGEWKVPVGGMGAVAKKLEEAARRSGAEMLTSVELRAIDPSGEKRRVEFDAGREDARRWKRSSLLVNFGLNVLSKYLGQEL